MKDRVLGKDLKVSPVGLGCMGMTHAYGALADEKEMAKLLEKAVDMGYTFFDTAECYTGVRPDGTNAYNEELVGAALKPYRDKVVIATKCGVRHLGDRLEVDCSPQAIRKAVEPVKDEILTYNGSVCDAVWSASAGYNTQTGTYGTCSGQDAWGSDVPYLQSVESPYEEQYHNLLRRSIGKDYTYVEYNDSRTGEPYTDADTTHKSLGGYVQYNTFVSNGRSYRYIGQFVSSRYCFDFGTDENGTPCMTYYGFGHGVGMSQCGAVGYAAEEGMGYRDILKHYYSGVSIRTVGSGSSSGGGLFSWLRRLLGM